MNEQWKASNKSKLKKMWALHEKIKAQINKSETEWGDRNLKQVLIMERT